MGLPRGKEDKEKLIGVCRRKTAERRFIMKKYCTRCGNPFEAVGREVICPSCKAAAAEESKKAAVLRAKKASWTGESVPVRISGRASTVIRRYGAVNNMPFAAALDDLLKASDFFQSTGKAWEEVTPYKSRRRDKHATEAPQEVTSKPQDVQEVKPQEVTKAAKTSVKQAAGKAASKAVKTSKTAGKA